MYRRQTTPKSLIHVIGYGWRLFRASFPKVFVLFFLSAVSVGLVFPAAQQPAAEPALPAFDAFWFARCLLLVLFMLLVFGTALSLTWAVCNGARQSLANALGVAVWRLVPLLGVVALYVIAVLSGLLLLIVPGVYLSVCLLFAAYAAVLDKFDPIHSLRYSRALVRGNWWRAASLLMLLAMAGVAAALALGVAGVGAPAADAPGYRGLVLWPSVSALLSTLGNAMFIALYQDLRLRHQNIGFSTD